MCHRTKPNEGRRNVRPPFITSQALSLASVVLVSFIPNDILRYIALLLTLLAFVAYLIWNNTPDRQVSRIDAALKVIDALFHSAANECARDPRFIYEAGLKLTDGIQSAHSGYRHEIYRLKAMSTPFQKPYTDHRRVRARNLQTSFQLALECTRQQTYREDIGHKIGWQPSPTLFQQVNSGVGS
ncbi:hypothetical protein C8R43DRAFT_681758 [Mycena crocata]|nr:hypothetical protein C8R43DRAFT_681758 [Mycena crocata]